jgi:exonuclease III
MIIVDFIIPLSPIGHLDKISKETSELNDAINQMDLIDIYREFHQAATQYTFFS